MKDVRLSRNLAAAFLQTREQIRPVDAAISVRHVFLVGDLAEEIVRSPATRAWT